MSGNEIKISKKTSYYLNQCSERSILNSLDKDNNFTPYGSLLTAFQYHLSLSTSDIASRRRYLSKYRVSNYPSGICKQDTGF